MRKVIAAMNMTLDGYCDHTVMNADDEIHQFYTDLLYSGDTILYGRITYQLMEDYWPTVVAEPTGNKQTDDFAHAMEKITKVVFSRTLKSLEWKSARLATKGLKEEIEDLKKQKGSDIFIGSPGLIAAATELNLLDELILSVHPKIVGKGLTLFKSITHHVDLQLQKTRVFGCGAVAHYYSFISPGSASR